MKWDLLLFLSHYYMGDYLPATCFVRLFKKHTNTSFFVFFSAPHEISILLYSSTSVLSQLIYLMEY